jgi:hypothetical protein
MGSVYCADRAFLVRFSSSLAGSRFSCIRVVRLRNQAAEPYRHRTRSDMVVHESVSMFIYGCSTAGGHLRDNRVEQFPDVMKREPNKAPEPTSCSS